MPRTSPEKRGSTVSARGLSIRLDEVFRLLERVDPHKLIVKAVRIYDEKEREETDRFGLAYGQLSSAAGRDNGNAEAGCAHHGLNFTREVSR